MSKEGASLVPHDIPKYQHIYPKEYEVYTQQAIDLLQRAGMTLSKYYETDLIVEYFIREKNYDIDEINGLLWEKDLSLLGQNTA